MEKFPRNPSSPEEGKGMRKSASKQPPRHFGARAAFDSLGKAVLAGDADEEKRRREELSRRGKKGGEASARKKDIAQEMKKLADERREREEHARRVEANEHVIPVDPRDPETPDSYR